MVIKCFRAGVPWYNPVMGKTFIGNNLTQGPPTISTNLVAWKVYTFNGLESAEPSIIPHDKNTELKQKP